ncbi:hypothetical protein FHR24_000793 [Wenyingzhuangia heitensis]|uniref:DUF748 domain-containing protein n=1 Tax=Wenyingzhuangia heitensis TaxID=1487859 RepID=A0ABX0U683_9FLAO|nr:hypothetical protein [Wenyingzhuangia heitensis]NIJ44354.1 hypothetical protein [Wenyingzhuangia heitensis]
MKKNKFILVLLVSVVGLFYIVQIGVNYFLKNKFSELIEQQELKVNYTDLDYNIFFNELQVKELKISSNVKKNDHISVAKIQLNGFCWLGLMFKKQLIFSKLLITSPKVDYSQLEDKNASAKKFSLGKIAAVIIDEIEIENADLMFNTKTKKTSGIFNLVLKEFTLNKETITDEIPFQFEKSIYTITNFYTDLSDLELLKFKELKGQDGEVVLSEMCIKSKDSKDEFSKKILEEKEHLDLFFEKIKIEEFFVKFNNHQQKIGAKKVELCKPKLQFYRDKRVPDNTQRKALYSESITKLKTVLDFPIIEIKDGLVVYEMLMDEGDEIGSLVFDKINGELNVSSAKGKEQLRLETQSLFMKKSPFSLSINFTDIEHDVFVSKGVLKNFKTDYINPFLYKILNTELEGEIEELYFTISGNNTVATGDVKMKYDNLKLRINKYNFVKRTVHVLGNLILKNSSNKEPEKFREGIIKEEREPTKSMFNFLWISLRTGIVDVVS